MNEKRKKVLTSILIVMLIALGGIVFYYWYNNTHFVITDDATVSGDLVKIGPQIAGKLIEFNVKEGSKVVKDQIVGHLEMVNNADSNIDLSLIRAPFDGVVIKKQCMVGEVEAAGQTLAMLVDPQSLYINANIEETKLGRVRTGQKVDITIDQFEGVKYTGKVDFVGLASNSTFSIIPSATIGTFTKVVQRIPVKILLDQNDGKLLPGTNAIVKIHVN